MNPKKSAGHDKIPPRMLKNGSSVLAMALTSLVNRLFQEGSFPQQLKLAELSPIFKKDNNLDKTKYRPISILPCISVVVEKLVVLQVNSFLNDLFHEHLSAYRKRFSTQHVVLKSVEDWKNSFDNRLCSAAVSIDLSKAFDVIPHGLLLSKLNAYGFNGTVLKFFHSYLSKRFQRVKIQNVHSGWSRIRKGIPQGSVLGPTLFNIFINDIFYSIDHATIYNYADDDIISCSANSYPELKLSLENSLNLMSNWFTLNGFQVNTDKFQVIVFGSDADAFNTLNVNGVTICCENVIRHLGVSIDSKLDFCIHIDTMCKKASRQVNALYRLRNMLDADSKLTIYKSFIKSIFDYCPLVWSFCNKSDLSKLCKIQVRAVRFLYNDFETDSIDLLSKYEIDDIRIHIVTKIVVEMYKCCNNLTPSYISNLFNVSQISYGLRNSSRNNVELR